MSADMSTATGQDTASSQEQSPITFPIDSRTR